jgi:MFS family permease
MIQAGILAFLTMTHQVQIWHLIALGVFAGIINAFDLPVRSAFVIGLVNKKEELPAAVSLNSSLMNFTRLLGPALAGFIVAAVGAGACFLINALSYIAAIVALIYIKGDFDPRRAASAGIVAELKEGLDYVWGTTPVRALILLLGFFALGGMAYALLLPIYVKQLGGDASMLGYMMSASAVGSLAGTLMLGIRGKIVGLGRWIIASSIGFSLALLGLGMVHSFAMALPVLALLGLTMMLQMASVNTILQAIVEENKRGRVMSYFTMAFMGAAPLGSLIAGGAAAKFGFSNTVLACGVYCLIVSAVFISHLPKLRPRMREIYIEKGLLIAEEERQLLST